MQSAKKLKTIAILCPYPLGIAPGQRFRFEMYLDSLIQQEINYSIYPFLDTETNTLLYSSGKTVKKTIGVLKGFMRRMVSFNSIRKKDYIYIYREATPIGPPIFEWLLAKIFRKKIIYDFDDAIFLPFKSSTNSITNKLKWTSKVGQICRWSYKVTVGNKFLAQFALNNNSNTIIIPTVVDTKDVHNKIKKHQSEELVIGWTGSHSTNFLLKNIEPTLSKLRITHQFKFIAISNADPELNLEDYQFIPWNKNTEIDDLINLDIGLMPLTKDAWNEGKCSFKAIQYLSLGIPAVISPIGMNTEVVMHGQNGYLAETDEDWLKFLTLLLENKALRNQYGANGRNHIVSNYSKEATTQKFIALFNEV